MEIKIEKYWRYMMKGKIRFFMFDNGSPSFLFEFKEEKYVIFRNSPYLFRARGMSLNS